MIMLNHNLRIFIRVAEKGSITETANELYISQPAVSKAIKILEDELNLKLFHRDKRKGLILTDIGHEILILARQMEKTENRMYQAAFRSNNFIGGKVRIASMPILTSVILSDSHEQNSAHSVFMRVCEAWHTSLSLIIYSNNQLQMV